MTQIISLLGKLTCWTAATVILASVSAANAQQSYKSPEDAVGALVKATRDEWPKGVVHVLGPDAAEIVSSGDKVADEAAREKFLAAYDAKHQVTMEGDNKAVAIIGSEDFPFPIPLTRKGAAWRFDTAAGRLEILYRRIGRNELNAIQACLAYVDAQNEYASKDRTGSGSATYAQRIVSRPGKKDGLFWPAAPGEEESPLGELCRSRNDGGLRRRRRADTIPRLLFQDTDATGADGCGWRNGLCRAWQDDRRICAGGLSGPSTAIRV